MPDVWMSMERMLIDAVSPTRGEVVAAKEAMLATLSDGVAHRPAALLQSLSTQREVAVPQRQEWRTELETDLPQLFGRQVPYIAWHRYYIASLEGLAELIAAGLVVATTNPENGEPTHPRAEMHEVHVSVMYRGTGRGVRIHPGAPRMDADGFRLTHGARTSGLLRHLLDVDLFTADLDGLLLDQRTQRCLDEAIAAYRSGLFLAAANMLGAAWEGAWTSAARRLQDRVPDIAAALDAGRISIARVQSAVTAHIRQRGRSHTFAADELAVHAALVRDLRNYGIHPQQGETDPRDRYLSEAGCALLMTTTHRSLTVLARETAADAGGAG